jgi:hypothetical protein
VVKDGAVAADAERAAAPAAASWRIDEDGRRTLRYDGGAGDGDADGRGWPGEV